MSNIFSALGSLPTWERGLKYINHFHNQIIIIVAPYMGAWIEIIKSDELDVAISVAPYMGAWIEISDEMGWCKAGKVAPYMGAWIEISDEMGW